MYDFDEFRREEWRLESLKFMVDNLCREIVRKRISREEALRRAETIRKRAMELVPDQMDLYDLIYGSRFKRFMDQFLDPESGKDEDAD